MESLTQKTPFYRTRLFWSLVITTSFIYSLIFYAINFSHLTATEDVLKAISIVFGSGLIVLLIDGNYLWYVVILFHLFQIFLITKTLKSSNLKLIYPILYISFFVISSIFSVLLLSAGS